MVLLAFVGRKLHNFGEICIFPFVFSDYRNQHIIFFEPQEKRKKNTLEPIGNRQEPVVKVLSTHQKKHVFWSPDTQVCRK